MRKFRHTSLCHSHSHCHHHLQHSCSKCVLHSSTQSLFRHENGLSRCYTGWLNLFNAELSPKRYWRGPRSQELGEEGDYTKLHCHHRNDSCINVVGDESHFNVSLTVRHKVTLSVRRVHFLKREESRSGIEPRSFCGLHQPT